MNNVFIGAVNKIDKQIYKELEHSIKKLINSYNKNFIDDRNESEWNREAKRLISKIELNLGFTKTSADYYKKVKFDNFKILKYYLNKVAIALNKCNIERK